MNSTSMSVSGSEGVMVCVDFGSTFTKTLLIGLDDGSVLARAEHRTTIDTDVLDGYDACLAELIEQDARAGTAKVRACSSAGGGLRIAVVGNEELITAEAGRRVALSSGGKVVAVLAAAGSLAPGALSRSRPDVVLLTGGTDGGNVEVLLGAARWLVESGWTGPVVVAGNTQAHAEVGEILVDVPHVLTDNVMPTIGSLAPDSARAAIREMFLAHVIGGKGLSRRQGGADFIAMVRGATPDVVLTGVEVLARTVGDVAVVDIGGATTDVHSVVELDPEVAGLVREVVAETALTRTVEGDLGMRFSALSTIEAADLPHLRSAAIERTKNPAYLPQGEADRDADEAIARAAVDLALRRHAGRSRVVLSPEGRVVERTGKDLREIDVLIGSGGVLRHGQTGVAERVLGAVLDHERDEGWNVPQRARVLVDTDYLLAAIGLLSEEHPEAAQRLAGRLGVA